MRLFARRQPPGRRFAPQPHAGRSDGASGTSVPELLGHATAATTLDVYIGLFEDGLRALAEPIDASHDAHKIARSVGTVWARDVVAKIADH